MPSGNFSPAPGVWPMPLRSCIGCRSVRGKGDLVRFVACQGVLTPDPGAVKEGRGAYICPDKECLKQACRKGAFSRALREKVALPELDELWDDIRTSGCASG